MRDRLHSPGISIYSIERSPIRACRLALSVSDHTQTRKLEPVFDNNYVWMHKISTCKMMRLVSILVVFSLLATQLFHFAVLDTSAEHHAWAEYNTTISHENSDPNDIDHDDILDLAHSALHALLDKSLNVGLTGVQPIFGKTTHALNRARDTVGLPFVPPVPPPLA